MTHVTITGIQDVPVIDLDDCEALSEAGWYATATGAEDNWNGRALDDQVERLTEALDGVTVAWQRVRTALAAVKEA